MNRIVTWKTAAWCAALLLIGVSAPLLGSNEEKGNVRPTLLSPVQQRMQQVVSVDFKDTNIDDVLAILARQANVDILKSPKVQGKVTAVLRDIPLSEALNNILEVHGFGYVATDNMIRVVPQEDIIQVRERLNSHVYRVTYANVADVEKALRGFLSEQGSISANIGTSNIIVTDVESKIRAINLFIEEIDRVTPQILVEARIYDISSQDKLDLGVQWQAGTATSFGEVPAGGTLGNQIGTIGNALQDSVTNPHTTGAFSGNTSNTTTASLLRFGILNDNMNIDAILRASQEDVRAKLLANPRIMVLDNQQAEIKIVEEIPYQELTETSAGGSIGTTQFRDVGVELRVTPHLTRDGLIRLQLNPKFSARTGDVLLNTGNPNVPPQPIISTRETTTTALIHNGQTVVIGGLKKQEVLQQVNKIPLLGDLPLLGGLFRFEGEKTINSELVIFITPYVIENPTLTINEQQYLKETDIPSPRTPTPKLGK
jgi:type IV pilus assembly protein PilQ